MNHEGVVVSVLCITYNHEKYIAQAIEGFLSQKTSFPIEIIIHDDASTDRTADIIREYDARYPNRITAILQTENQFSRGIAASSILIEKARGKYIAFCEGDDYWTDPYKLETQVSILEAHPECAASTHNEVVVTEDGIPWPENYQTAYREKEDRIIGAEKLYDYCKFSHTACIVARHDSFEIEKATWKAYLEVKANGDMKWAALIAVHGKVYHIARDMACYRLVQVGNDSWSSRNHGKNIALSTYNQLMAIREFMKKFYDFDPSYEGYIKKLTAQAIITTLKKPTKENFCIMRELEKKTEYRFSDFLTYALKRVENKIVK